jgi:hypothetical protein
MTVHSLQELETLLRRGLKPLTTNRDALLCLGFSRACPRATSGYDSRIWERTIDPGRRSQDGLRTLVHQRAILTGAAASEPASDS